MTSESTGSLSNSFNELGRRTFVNDLGEEIKVIIGLPMRNGGEDCFIEYMLEGIIWTGKVRRSYGVDQIQAIYLALQSIGTDLRLYQKSTGQVLRWQGGVAGDLGLPEIELSGEY